MAPRFFASKVGSNLAARMASRPHNDTTRELFLEVACHAPHHEDAPGRTLIRKKNSFAATRLEIVNPAGVYRIIWPAGSKPATVSPL